MIDSFSKPNEKPSKKNKLPPSTKPRTQKDPNNVGFNKSETRLKYILNPTATNKLNSSFSKQKTSKKDSDFDMSRLNKSSPSGKENKSHSPKKSPTSKKSPKKKSKSPKKKSKASQPNLSMTQKSTLKKMFNTTMRSSSQDKTSTLNTSMDKYKKASPRKKIPSGSSLDKLGALHKRYNSSMGSRHSRVDSSDKKSSYLLRTTHNLNTSMFNNSFLFEDPMNYSKEYTGLKEYDTSEFINLGELAGLYNNSFKLGKNEKLNKMSTPTRDASTPNDDEDMTTQDPSQNLYISGKTLFKQKKYKEAVECLKECIQCEGENSETLYLLGMSYLWLGQYQEAKIELAKVVERESPPAKCSAFILLSTVHKKLDDPISAIKTLTKAITKYPDRSDVYIFRAKIYLKLKNWERALSDFKRGVQIDPSRVIGYIGQGDAHRMLLEYREAIACYTEAIKLKTSLSRAVLLKRAIALTELKHYNEAINDLNAIILEDPNNSEAHYFKGIILEKQKNTHEAILSFEQAIKHDTSKKAVLKSLYEITRIKIEERNFYEAQHTLHRAELLRLDLNYFKKLRLFTEGVIHLMKKKFDIGVTNLTDALKCHFSASLIPMIYSYRAYGNFCLGRIKKALQDYQEVQKLSKLDKSSTYNKLLCEGILAAQIDNFESALTLFDKALKIYSNKAEPHFYKATLTIQAFRKSHQKSDKVKMVNSIEKSLKDLDKALDLNESCSSLYYVKAVLLYMIEDLDLAYTFVKKAIEKADDYDAKYYYLKGAIYAVAGNYQQAISNLSTAINIDKNFRPSYLERAKCYFTMGELKQVFLDIQSYISIKGNDPNIHLWAGNLLFSTGAYEDATRAYSNSENINKSEVLLCRRAKCYLLIKEPTLALNDLCKLVDLQTTSNIHYYIDRECLRSILLATTLSKGDNELDGVNIVKAIQTISKILSYKMSGEIFHLDDLYFYKSVLHFYLQEYEQALDDLDLGWEFRQELNEILKKQKKPKKEDHGDHIKITEELPPETPDKMPDDDDDLDEGYSFSKPEYFYNRAIYLLMANKYQESGTMLENLRENTPIALTKQKVEALIKLIHMQSLKGTKDKDPFNGTSKLKSQELIVFPYKSRLCSLFPPFKLPLISSTIYETRLSFCFPLIEPPSMVPSINYDILDEITVLSVENRPEAPWIRRNPEGVVFTEEFMQNEEKEIDNLSEIIRANGLRGEDVYESLGKSEEKLKSRFVSEPDHDHEAETDETIQYPTELDYIKDEVPTQEPLTHHFSEII